MSSPVVTALPDETVAVAASRMNERSVGSVVVVDLDLRARRREVEEVLGVDLGDQTTVVAIDQVADRTAGCVAGVVPPLERRYQHRPIERGS